MTYSHLASLCVVEAGCEVSVFWISGRQALRFTPGASDDLTTLSRALAMVLGPRRGVPVMALHFIWCPADQGRVTAFVLVQEIRRNPVLDEFRPGAAAWHGSHWCFACYDSCHDADEPSAPRSRQENCARCEPDCICEHCRLWLPVEQWCCFLCLEARDLAGLRLSRRQLRRMCAVLPSLRELDPPDADAEELVHTVQQLLGDAL